MTFSGHDDSTINIVLELLLLLLLHGKRPKKMWTACFLYSRTETEAATQNTHSWMETNAYATFFYLAYALQRLTSQIRINIIKVKFCTSVSDTNNTKYNVHQWQWVNYSFRRHQCHHLSATWLACTPHSTCIIFLKTYKGNSWWQSMTLSTLTLIRHQEWHPVCKKISLIFSNP